MSRHLQKITDYNLEYGFTQKQLKAMVEDGSNLESIVVDKNRLAENGFVIDLSSHFRRLQFQDLTSIVINGQTIKKKSTKNKSYGENDVILYLFDMFNNSHNYLGTFVVRHGVQSETYLALKRYDAMHNLKCAENYK